MVYRSLKIICVSTSVAEDLKHSFLTIFFSSNFPILYSTIEQLKFHYNKVYF